MNRYGFNEALNESMMNIISTLHFQLKINTGYGVDKLKSDVIYIGYFQRMQNQSSYHSNFFSEQRTAISSTMSFKFHSDAQSRSKSVKYHSIDVT